MQRRSKNPICESIFKKVPNRYRIEKLVYLFKKNSCLTTFIDVVSSKIDFRKSCVEKRIALVGFKVLHKMHKKQTKTLFFCL